MRRMFSQRALLWLAPWVCIAGLTSCSGVDDAPGTQVESPAPRPRPKAPAPSSSVEAAEAPKPQASGTALTSLDADIAGDWPPRPWSKNVPDQACVNDSECGDGFCDRGQCAAIWTETENYGQKCDAVLIYLPQRCGGPESKNPGKPLCERQVRLSCLCIDGRCRSCVSDDECVKHYGSPKALCGGPDGKPSHRRCGVPQAPLGQLPPWLK